MKSRPHSVFAFLGVGKTLLQCLNTDENAHTRIPCGGKSRFTVGLVDRDLRGQDSSATPAHLRLPIPGSQVKQLRQVLRGALA